jgi:hypothetical protein
MHRKWAEGIGLVIGLKATLSIVFPWFCNVNNRQATGAGAHVRPRQRRRRWFRHRVCDVFNMFEVGEHVLVFNCIIGSIEFNMLSGINVSGCIATCPILLVLNFKAFRMV